MRQELTYPVSFPRLTIGDKDRLTQEWADTRSRRSYIKDLIERLADFSTVRDANNVDTSVVKYFKRIKSFAFWDYTDANEILIVMQRAKKAYRAKAYFEAHSPYPLDLSTIKKTPARARVRTQSYKKKKTLQQPARAGAVKPRAFKPEAFKPERFKPEPFGEQSYRSEGMKAEPMPAKDKPRKKPKPHRGYFKDRA